ncbi:unnamed protein product [Prorocentrum cordatum]|uniref:Uncharacterized protein n=1 Tax=Prorocentrum cordatum TaxID=2364126 RepID=A0ABN9VMZ2_9DINO|nr:unnamed protein product [Polarella glacialis]
MSPARAPKSTNPAPALLCRTPTLGFTRLQTADILILSRSGENFPGVASCGCAADSYAGSRSLARARARASRRRRPSDAVEPRSAGSLSSAGDGDGITQGCVPGRSSTRARRDGPRCAPALVAAPPRL